MERKIYQPTEAQEKKWSLLKLDPMPSDKHFQETWKRQHHGKLSRWGIGKRDWV